MLHEGDKPKKVALIRSISQPTVYDWHHRFQEKGLEGLANQPKSGRPRKTNQVYEDLLEEVVEKDPQELGYNFTTWTAGRLKKHMSKQTGIELGETQFRVLLKEKGFVYGRPKHDLSNLQDPQARETAQEWVSRTQKKGRNRRD